MLIMSTPQKRTLFLKVISGLKEFDLQGGNAYMKQEILGADMLSIKLQSSKTSVSSKPSRFGLDA